MRGVEFRGLTPLKTARGFSEFRCLNSTIFPEIQPDRRPQRSSPAVCALPLLDLFDTSRAPGRRVILKII